MAALANDPTRSSAAAAMLERYAFVREADGFVDLEARELVSRRNFDLRCASATLDPMSCSKRASAKFLSLVGAQVVDGVTYRLGDALFVDEEYGRCVNLASAGARKPLPVGRLCGVGPWIALLRHVLPDARSFSDVICWLAWVVQNPTRRPERHLVLGGAPGIGKSLLLEPVRAAVGASNFDEMMSVDCKRFGQQRPPRRFRVILDDLSGTVTRRRHRSLSRPRTEPLLIKTDGLKAYPCVDTSAVVGFTHCSKSAELLAADPCLLTLWSDARPATDEFYARIVAWYGSGGAAEVARWLAELDLELPSPAVARTLATVAHGYRGSSLSDLDQRILEAVDAGLPPFATELIALPEAVEHFQPGLNGAEQREAIQHMARLLGARTEGRMLGARRLGRTPRNCSRPLRCQGRVVPLFARRNADAYLSMSAGELTATFWEQRRPRNDRPLSRLERPWLRVAFVSPPGRTDAGEQLGQFEGELQAMQASGERLGLQAVELREPGPSCSSDLGAIATTPDEQSSHFERGE